MSRYQAGEYAQEEYSDDSVNVNCVLTCHWRLAERGRDHFSVDFHDGRYFEAGTRPTRSSRLELVYRTLCQNDIIRTR